MDLAAAIQLDMNRIAERVNNATRGMNDSVAVEAGEMIAEQMKQNTAQGKAFGSDRYDPEYQGYNAPQKRGKSNHSGYARTREIKGLNTNPVIMRFKSNRIEGTKVKGKSTFAEISFENSTMGVVFGYHQKGIHYANVGLRIRSIFPVDADSVPKSVRDYIKKRIFEIIGESK